MVDVFCFAKIVFTELFYAYLQRQRGLLLLLLFQKGVEGKRLVWNSRLSSHSSSSYKLYIRRILVFFLEVLFPLSGADKHHRRSCSPQPQKQDQQQLLCFPRLKYTITAQRRVVISINNRICIHLCCTRFLFTSPTTRCRLRQFNICIPNMRITDISAR